MATVTENDLKEIKDLITAQSLQMANMQSQFIDFQITDLKVSVEKIEATLQTQQFYLQKVEKALLVKPQGDRHLL